MSENIYLRRTKQHQVHFRRCSNSQQFKPFLWQIKINILTNDEMFYWMIWWPFVNRSKFHENSDVLSMPKVCLDFESVVSSFFFTNSVALLIFVDQHQVYFKICRWIECHLFGNWAEACRAVAHKAHVRNFAQEFIGEYSNFRRLFRNIDFDVIKPDNTDSTYFHEMFSSIVRRVRRLVSVGTQSLLIVIGAKIIRRGMRSPWFWGIV